MGWIKNPVEVNGGVRLHLELRKSGVKMDWFDRSIDPRVMILPKS